MKPTTIALTATLMAATATAAENKTANQVPQIEGYQPALTFNDTVVTNTVIAFTSDRKAVCAPVYSYLRESGNLTETTPMANAVSKLADVFAFEVRRKTLHDLKKQKPMFKEIVNAYLPTPEEKPESIARLGILKFRNDCF